MKEKERKITAPEGCESERELEQQCVTFARSRGWDAWKNENNGNKGIPDRSFLKKDVFLMVEFKRPDGGGRISKGQLLWKNRHPHTVHFCNSLDDFKGILECYEKGGEWKEVQK